MKGYRCDTCHDFGIEEEKTEHSMFRPTVSVPPESWIRVYGEGAEKPLHFCSAACVIAWAEQRGANSVLTPSQ